MQGRRSGARAGAATALFVLAVFSAAAAQCNNLCSGHGDCHSGSLTTCACWAGWGGGDCSLSTSHMCLELVLVHPNQSLRLRFCLGWLVPPFRLPNVLHVESPASLPIMQCCQCQFCCLFCHGRRHGVQGCAHGATLGLTKQRLWILPMPWPSAPTGVPVTTVRGSAIARRASRVCLATEVS